MECKLMLVGLLFLEILPLITGEIYKMFEGVFEGTPSTSKAGITTPDECIVSCQFDDTCRAVTHHGDTLQCDFHNATSCLLGTLNALSIYNYKDDPACSFPYLGCYNDGRSRDLSRHMGYFSATHATPLTLHLCFGLCIAQGYKYMGLQGEGCFCGNDYGSRGKGDESHCNKPCPGDPNTMCGGHWKNSIYRITE
ncbi:unnamed protein product [Owenia fusiformis]|uniref:Uncharacterized protein n=1 Tax=Owenia fusiformis TaxID=6347 RepID=A0A8J1XNL4_OWEFU|nr:unnamed protein product [Owenia fusiformis]